MMGYRVGYIAYPLGLGGGGGGGGLGAEILKVQRPGFSFGEERGCGEVGQQGGGGSAGGCSRASLLPPRPNPAQRGPPPPFNIRRSRTPSPSAPRPSASTSRWRRCSMAATTWPATWVPRRAPRRAAPRDPRAAPRAPAACCLRSTTGPKDSSQPGRLARRTLLRRRNPGHPLLLRNLLCQVAALAPNRAAIADALSPLQAAATAAGAPPAVAGGEGAIYFWARLPAGFEAADEEVVGWLIREHGVCVIPVRACARAGGGGLGRQERHCNRAAESPTWVAVRARRRGNKESPC
jgi:hypothetical protein